MILLVDAGDAFSGSLVQCLETLGEKLVVLRIGAEVPGGAPPDAPDGVVLSGRPGAAADRDALRAAIRRLSATTPLLAVGDGHLALAEAFGADLTRLARVSHGGTSPVLHRARGVFAGLEVPFTAARYHALAVVRTTLPPVLEVAAWTPEGQVMALRHRERDTWGVQFHPQSILTGPGPRLIENFLTLCRQHKEVPR
jgi:anthranilate synthase/aminodeoxychorismate synthase-like glutamine amidotransferase